MYEEFESLLRLISETTERDDPEVMTIDDVLETDTAPTLDPSVNATKCSYCKLRGHNYTSRHCTRRKDLINSVYAYQDCTVTQERTREWLETLERIDYIIICKQFSMKMSLKTKESTADIKDKILTYFINFREKSKQSRIRCLNLTINNNRKFIVESNRRIVDSQTELTKLQPNYRADAELRIVLKTPETDTEIDCPICFDCVKPQYVVQFGCNHRVCSNCTYEMIQKKVQCPMCRTSISNITVHSNCIKASLEQVFR